MTFEQILYEFIELRSYERFFGMSIGALAIFLGFALFKSGIETPQSAIAKIGDYEFKFLKVAPGIFFSLFGVLLVGYITYEHPTLEKVKTTLSPNENNKTAQAEKKDHIKIFAGFSKTEYDELMSLAQPINTAKQALNNLPRELPKGVKLVDSTSYGHLVQAVNSLRTTLNNKIFNSLPVEVFDACAGNGTMPKQFTKDICLKIEELKKGTIK